MPKSERRTAAFDAARGRLNRAGPVGTEARVSRSARENGEGGRVRRRTWALKSRAGAGRKRGGSVSRDARRKRMKVRQGPLGIEGGGGGEPDPPG